MDRMRAIVHDRYGPPDVLELAEIEKPELTDDGVLVRVRAASVNRLDWYGVTGTPYVARAIGGLLKPKERGLGVDFAGTVEAVGKDITHVRPGDEVYGGRTGAFAEYVSVPEAVVPKPANLTFEEAAAVPVAAITALQGFRDKAQLQPGQTVLVNGASGGVGTFAVQIAKALGAEVTAVCSTRNVDQARSLGADHVVDYTREDFTRSGRRYDVLFDVAARADRGRQSHAGRRKALRPERSLRRYRVHGRRARPGKDRDHGARRMIHAAYHSADRQGAEMRAAAMSITKGFSTYSEGMTLAAQNAQLGDPGACRRR